MLVNLLAHTHCNITGAGLPINTYNNDNNVCYCHLPSKVILSSLSVSLWSRLHKHKCWIVGNRATNRDSCVMPVNCIWSVCGFITQQRRFYPPWDWGVGHPLVTYYFSHLTGFTRSKGVTLPGVLWLNSVYHSAGLTQCRRVYCWPGMPEFVQHSK